MKSLTKILILFLLTSCGSSKEEEETGLNVYNLDEEFTLRELSISELMNEPELVALETSDESLLPGNFRFLVGNDIIIINDYDRIMMFGRDGSFIRQIANAGRGPGEFQNFISWTLGPYEELLYVAHYGNQKGLNVYNLKEGSHSSIDIPNQASNLLFLENNWIMISGNTETDFKAYELNVETGEVRNRIDQVPVENSMVRMSVFLAKTGNEIYYSGYDTLFRLENNESFPEAIFTEENPLSSNLTSSSASIFNYTFVSSDFIIISKTNLELTFSNGNISGISSQSNDALFVDRKTNELFKSEKLAHEPTTDLNSLIKFNETGSWRTLIYEAHSWLEILESENGESLPANLIEASAGLNMEDNPVLIIGKVPN